MNKQRRKDIQALVDQLNEHVSALEDIRGAIESLRDEEQEYKDSMPENLQYGSNGERADEAIDALENAASSLESLELSDIIEYLESAME